MLIYNLRSCESNTRLINFSLQIYHYLKLVPLLDFFNVEEITCYGRTPLIKGLSIQHKIPENSYAISNGTDKFRFGPTGIFGTSFDGGPL